SQILVLSCIVFSCFLFFFYGSGDHRDLHSFPTRRSSDLYAHDELQRLMDNIDWVIVPSIWWENSPLVIQEAFAYGKPILCSDIGGMAEKVTHGVNGLHFHVRDPVHLAQRIREAASTPGLWENLRRGTPPLY